MTYDLVVLGGGSAGISCTVGAATLGARVMLIEKHRMGGDCLNDGCIPSKAFIKAASAAWQARHADRFGIHADPQVRFKEVIRYVQDAIHRVSVHDSASQFEKLGAEVVFGSPRFTSPRTLEVDGRHVDFKRCVIATGTRPRTPRIPGLQSFITNVDVFHLETQPRRLLIVGGGPIGCELAQAFARLGTDVCLIDTRLLKREDVDVSNTVRQCLEADGVRVCLDRVVSATEGGLVLSKETVEGDVILFATGRQANVDGLDLEQAAVKLDECGYVACNAGLRTTSPRIWTCGDVHGGYQFSHVAEYEARFVIAQALFHVPMKPSYRIVPWTTFTDPEVAHVGLTEAEATARGIRYEVWRFDTADVDRAMTEAETRGFFKILTGRRGAILGAAIVAPNAGDIIHEAVLAMTYGLTAKDLSAAIHVYPTMSLGLRRAADAYTLAHLAPPWLLKAVRSLFRRGRL